MKSLTDLLAALLLAFSTIQGDANQAARSHGPDYLAMRLPRGTLVTVCGVEHPTRCWRNARTTDYGPAKKTGDIADIALDHWLHVCKLPQGRGECEVRVTVLGPRPTLPPTDTE